MSDTLMSRLSGFAMVCITIAQSSAYRHIGPRRSCVHESAITPYRLIRPNVGRSPVTPHRAEGLNMEPLVSEPNEKPTRPAAVAEPGPADDPLEPWFISQGFFVWPPHQLSPCASSPLANFARMTAPALRNSS